MLCNNQRKDKLRNKWRIKGILAVKHIRPGPRTKPEHFSFLSLSLSLCALQCVCLSVRRFVCPPLCVCSPVGKLLSQGDTKVQRAWLPHYGIKAVSSANTRKSSRQMNSKAHTRMDVCVCAWVVCVFSHRCVLSIENLCDRQPGQAEEAAGATPSGNGQLTPGHRIN